MKDSYKATIQLPSPPNMVFESISKKLGDWWGKQDKEIDREGVIFKVSWGEPWYQFKVIKYEQNQEMIWECIDANQKISGLSGVEKEWVGTKIHWLLEKLDSDDTSLGFMHEGLVAEILCFDFCSKSWEHFLKEGLVNYLREQKDLQDEKLI